MNNNTIYTKENPRVGVAVIVVEGDKILIGYDGIKKKYAFPGGIWADQKDETTEEAAEREVYEETGGTQGKSGIGIKCKNLKKLYEYTFYREDVSTWYKSIGYAAEILEGTPGDDFEESRSNWMFVYPQDALKLDLFEPARNGLKEYIESEQKATGR